MAPRKIDTNVPRPMPMPMPTPPINRPTPPPFMSLPIPTPLPPGPGPGLPEPPSSRTPANTLLFSILKEYGLENLYSFAEEVWTDGATTTDLMLQLQDTEQFKERFKGLEMRRAQGLNAISVKEYIDLERSYQQTMAAFGLPPSFYDSPDDFAQWIGNDVSAEEVSARAGLAAKAASEVDPELKMQLENLYGISDDPTTGNNELVAYFLDPERTATLVDQRLQMEAAGLSSAAVRSLGQGFDAGTAERLASQNVQQREITQRLTPQAGLTQATLGDQGVTTSELAASEFGLDSETTALVKRLRQRRQASGKQQSGTMTSGAGLGGLRSAAGQIDS